MSIEPQTETKKDIEEFYKKLETLLKQTEKPSEIKYLGEPTKEQLTKINGILKKESQSDSWYIVTFRASDNLVNRSYRKWHINTLVKMAATMVGNPLLVDHDWYSTESAVGFILDAAIVRNNSKPDYQKLGYEEINQKIINKEGYIEVIATAAIPKLEEQLEIIDCIDNLVLNACSTGGEINNVRLICPNCSELHGREVSFTERGVKGEYICPHMLPESWNMYYQSEDEMEEYLIADYVELDGNYENLELSLCNIGNLPNARIIR